MATATRTKPRRAARRPRSEPTSARLLRRYHAKRNLAESGEPGGEKAMPSAAAAVFRYVIQKHDATRLHYDLRLEMDGVYKSWAVPKGLPTTPGEKSLAVEVEDHPLDYGTFEGTIPKGNYGAGTVMVWDRGFYTVEGGDPVRALRRGKVHFALAGDKCRGEWTLVRMRHADEKVNWLVIKNHDTSTEEPIASDGRDRSVQTGRTLDEIAANKPARKTRGKRAAVQTKSAQKKSREKPDVRDEPVPGVNSADDSGASLSDGYVEPMKALGVKEIPAGREWLLEVKFDGYRALAILKDGRATLWSRNRNDLSSAYPEIVAALEKLKCRDAILDGEIVAMDAEGRPSFQQLQGLGQAGEQRPPLFYYVFDLLRQKGETYLQRPIEERKEALAQMLKKAPDALRVSPVFRERPTALMEEARRKGLEGIVAKQPGSLYEPGQRSGAWLKCRLAHEQEFVIGGYTPPGGSRPHFGAILVGYYDGDDLVYCGKVGSGFNGKLLASLHAKFDRIRTDKCPFANLPMPRKPRFGLGMTANEMRAVTWLKPKLVAQIHFNEWTRDSMLRQPVFLGLREDKSAHEVVREVNAA